MDGDRRGDWEKGVDENLAMLNSAQRTLQAAARVTDRQQDDLELKYVVLDKVVRGDPEEGTDGLIGRQHALETTQNDFREEIRILKLELHGDHANGGGLIHRVGRLEGNKESTERRAEKREGYFWHFVTAVAVQLILLAGALIANWDRVEDFFRRRFRHEPPAHMETKRRGRPRRQKPIATPEMNDESSASNVP